MSSINNTLLIGIGNTGASSILFLKDKFYNRNIKNIELLAIDTDYHINEKKIHERLSLNTKEILCLYPQKDDIIKSRFLELNKWFTNHQLHSLNYVKMSFNHSYASIGDRHIGRLVLFLNFEEIKNTIQKKINSLSNYEQETINIKLILSSAGGIGSGMLVDLIILLKHYFSCNIDLFIVLPDIFLSLGNGPAFAHIVNNARNVLDDLDLLTNKSKNGLKIEYPWEQISINSNPVNKITLINIKKDCRLNEMYEEIANLIFSEMNNEELDLNNIYTVKFEKKIILKYKINEYRKYSIWEYK